ncbi:hypothetical protein OAD64_00135 [Oceanospirillaceae bacterium]|jgi:hypothetical protein|nr:hypothetical protein [Oceanospirillaceae bacterium]|tara:strand:+ start:674 stop:886 length:213 start_codon:yes stop_codon:yes gene_type:complete
MEALFEALAFLVKAATIGGITGVVLAILGIVPIQFNRYIEIHVDEADKATKILKSWGLSIEDMEEEEEGE